MSTTNRNPKSVALLRAGVCIAALMAASPALAAAECGADGAGADTITCTGASFPNGITYAGSDGLSLVLNDPTMAVLKGTATDGINLGGTTTNDLAVTATSLTSINGGTGTAVTVSNGGDGKAALTINAGTFTAASANTVYVTHGSGAGDSVITINGGTATNTSGINSLTLNAEVTGSGTGNATVLMTGGTVQTNGNTGSVALNAVISNAVSSGNASVTMTGGTMTVAGIGARASTNGSGLAQVIVNGAGITSTGTTGAWATNTGSGNATVSMTNGSAASGTVFASAGIVANTNTGTAMASATNSTITATAGSGAGIYAFSTTGSVTASMTGGSIASTGTSGGLKAVVTGTSSGSASAFLNGGTIHTIGTTLNASGVNSQATNGQSMVQMTGGTVTTSGSLAYGLRSDSLNGLSVVQMSGGTVTANGANTPGVVATTQLATGTGTYNISISGGTVTGSGAGAVEGYSPMGGVIAIGAGAVINAKAGTSGVAIGTTGTSAGNAAITTAGTITGQIKFQPGTANTLDITGGSIAGDINGGGSDALSFDLGSGGSFNYDAAYAITGVTSVAMNSGTVSLANTMTTNAVTITGGTLVLTGAINAPAFALNGGTLSVSNDTNLGTDVGALNFNGGILQVTGTSMTGTARPLTWGVNGGGFDIADAGNVFTLNQTLAGGPLTKLGAGTLVLTANNTTTGGTTIGGGTLQLGDGNTTGGITGNVVNNGALVFNRADSVSFAGAISGTGGTSQEGSGTTILTGNNSYTGNTYVTDGTLQVSSGGVVNGTSYTEVGTRLIVTGAGSSFTDTGDLVTGRGAGAAAITVNNGGHLTTSRSFLGEGSNQSTSDAITITVDGAGSVWNAGSFVQLSAAAGGTATLIVSNGGVMTAPGGGIAIGRGGDGTALVTGAGSQLLSRDNLQIGTSFNGGTGNGKLTIADGGVVTASTVALGYNDGVSIGNSGTLIVQGTPGARGVLQTASLSKGDDAATATFDGGILRASGSSTDFISSYAGDYVTIGAGGMFIDTNGFDVTASSALTGAGALTKQGAGTLILSANNGYASGTVIETGTLQLGNGGTTGGIAGNVANNGILAFDRSDFASFGGVISGAGAVVQSGVGVTVLTGANTYTGGTTISAGGLQLGNSGTSGGITGDVINNGALVFRRSDNVAFGGVISGSGIVGQTGTGNTTLTGVNIYTGGTIIGTGTLTGSATSFGSGPITDNGALVIGQAADAAFANAINSSGSFTKQGAGRLNYTGTAMLTGATTVTAGTLSVNGSLAASAITVQSGATLGGNGTVGATIIQSGATIAPGNSIGTLHINGAYRQAAGSIYQVQLDPNSNASDLITASGAATLDSGAGLTVVKDQPGPYRLGAKYTVLHADGGVSGTYALGGDTLAASPYLGLRDSYDANNAYLTVVQTADPATAAQTGNQAQTATGVNSLPVTNDVPTAVLNTPDPVTTRSAFDQLSGAAIASANSLMISGSVLVRDTTFDRLRDVFCATPDNNRHTGCVAFADRPTVWAQGFGGWNQIYGNGNAAGISQTTGGFLVGADVAVQDWRVGVFGGYSRSDFASNARNSQGRSDSYHLGAYGGTAWGDLGLRMGASYSWNGLATERLVAFDDFSNDLRATYKAGTTQFFTELGQKIALDGLLVEPFANLAYVNLHTGGFRETGGAAALTSRASSLEDTFATLGVRPSTEFALGDTAIVARGMLGWRHTFGDMRPASVVSFDGDSAFTVAGVPIARDTGVVEAGFNLGLSDTAALGLTYGGQFSNRETDHSIRGTIAITF